MGTTMNDRIIPLLALVVAAGLGGCADDRMSLEIRQTCYPTDDCTFGDTCDLQYLGTYSQMSPYPMRIYFEVANQAPNNGDIGAGRVNSNDAHVTGATIEFSGARTGTYTVPNIANQLVPADGTAVIGIWFPSGGTGAVTGDVRLTGYYDNGREFESGAYPFNYQAGVTAATVLPCATGEVQVCPPGNGTVSRLQLPSVCGTP
jgi:hypothetical protein